MGNKRFNLFYSFRSRIVFFVFLVLLATIATLYFINRHSEERITRLVADYFRSTSLAVDLAQSSFLTSQYLYILIPQDERLRVGLDESHIIHRILIADESGVIIDSSERKDVGENIKQVLGDLTPAPFTKLQRKRSEGGREPEQVLTYPVETDKGIRRIAIIISPHRLDEIVAEEAFERWAGIAILSVILILTVAIASWRFTRPIDELMNAARRVSAGDYNFNVLIKRRDEIGSLAKTFNEMLAGLRNKSVIEEKLQRAERSAVVGRLASGIAHEIRNPLSFINLTIDYMRGRFAPATETDRKDYTQLIDNVKNEIARLNQMVSDFLNFGRPAKLKLRDLDARALIEDVMSLVRAKAEQEGVRLTLKELAAQKAQEDERRFDAHLLADADQIKTCFSNIAINAVQAMPGGGELTITLHPQKTNIRIEFEDTGPGILPESLGQIFEPYFSTKETGIGLGLPLTKKLIEDHGGQVSVSSEMSVGTKFTVLLPREPATEQRTASTSQPSLNTV